MSHVRVTTRVGASFLCMRTDLPHAHGLKVKVGYYLGKGQDIQHVCPAVAIH